MKVLFALLMIIYSLSLTGQISQTRENDLFWYYENVKKAYDKKKYKEAEAFLDEYLKYNPDDYEAIIDRANISFESSAYIEAITFYTRAIRIRPSGELLYLRGISYCELSKKEDGCQDLRRSYSEFDFYKAKGAISNYCR